eukprot:374633-Amphidinium_carterae.1
MAKTKPQIGWLVLQRHFENSQLVALAVVNSFGSWRKTWGAFPTPRIMPCTAEQMMPQTIKVLQEALLTQARNFLRRFGGAPPSHLAQSGATPPEPSLWRGMHHATREGAPAKNDPSIKGVQQEQDMSTAMNELERRQLVHTVCAP